MDNAGMRELALRRKDDAVRAQPIRNSFGDDVTDYSSEEANVGRKFSTPKQLAVIV